MNFKRQKERRKVRKIALERINILLSRADDIYKNNSSLALRYSELARKIAMKARVKLPAKWRLRFCKKCKSFLYPGITARVRIQRSNVHSRLVYSCLLCGDQVKRAKVFKPLTKKSGWGFSAKQKYIRLIYADNLNKVYRSVDVTKH